MIYFIDYFALIYLSVPHLGMSTLLCVGLQLKQYCFLAMLIILNTTHVCSVPILIHPGSLWERLVSIFLLADTTFQAYF